jgi:hypothetical protein
MKDRGGRKFQITNPKQIQNLKKRRNVQDGREEGTTNYTNKSFGRKVNGRKENANVFCPHIPVNDFYVIFHSCDSWLALSISCSRSRSFP